MRIAVIQMNSQNNWQQNMEKALRLIRQAIDQGATLIGLPENVLMMAAHSSELLQLPVQEMSQQYLAEVSSLVQAHGVTVLAGTIPMPTPQGKFFNRLHLIAPQGQWHYDKMHLCDIILPNGQSLNESERYQPGEKPVLVPLAEQATLGLSICYDLRFPHLYRTLAKKGATILTVPSAFTKPTGEAHWYSLLRARAIENGCYVIAPAQVGAHPGGRHTYGHALIIDPWGKVLADAGEEEGVVIAHYDAGFLAEVRQKVPSLQHDRPILA